MYIVTTQGRRSTAGATPALCYARTMDANDAAGRDACQSLLSLAVHELRTPAGVVHGYLHMLQRIAPGALDERQRRMVDEAERSCARLVGIIAEIAEVAKLDAGTVSVAQQPLDLFELVESAASHLQEGADRGVRFAAAGDGAGALMTGDANRLKDALAAVFRALLRERAHPCSIVADRRLVSRDGRRSAVIVVAADDAVEAAATADRGPFDDRRHGLGFSLVIAARVFAAHGGRLSSPTGPLDRTAAVIEFPLPTSD